MATHTLHDDVHEHGLADGCPRCDEHAEHPERSLDADCLASIMFRHEAGMLPRSGNERAATNNYLAYLNGETVTYGEIQPLKIYRVPTEKNYLITGRIYVAAPTPHEAIQTAGEYLNLQGKGLKANKDVFRTRQSAPPKEELIIGRWPNEKEAR